MASHRAFICSIALCAESRYITAAAIRNINATTNVANTSEHSIIVSHSRSSTTKSMSAVITASRKQTIEVIALRGERFSCSIFCGVLVTYRCNDNAFSPPLRPYSCESSHATPVLIEGSEALRLLSRPMHLR